MLPASPIQRRLYRLAVVAALAALALALRWGWPGLIDFKLDEATLSQKALDIARGRDLPLSSVWSSVGVPTPPYVVYLFAIPYLFSGSPLVATGFVGLLAVIGLCISVWLADRYFGLLSAALAGFLYAVAPWPVLYARKMLPQSALPLFVALTIVSGVLGFVERRARWQAVHLALLALSVGIHFSALSLTLVTLYLLIAFRRRINWCWLAVGALIAVLLSVPTWIVVAQEYEAIRADLASRPGNEPVRLSDEALRLELMNTVGTQIYTQVAPEAPPGHPARADATTPLLWLEGGLLAGGLIALGVVAWRRRAEPVGQVAGILVAWTLAPVMLFSVTWTPVYHHYFVPLFPAPYLVIGAALGLGLERLRAGARGWRVTAAAGGLMLLAIGGAQIFALSRVMNFFATSFTPGDYGVPLGMKMDAARAALDVYRAEDAREILVIGEGDRTWGHESAAVFDVIFDALPHRPATGSQTAVFPDGPSVVMIVPGRWEAQAWYDRIAERRAILPTRKGEEPFLIYFYDGKRAFLDDFTPPESQGTLANGVTILGYRWEASAGRVSLAWQIEAGPSLQPDYHFAVFLFDEAGSAVAQADGPSCPSEHWRAGDVAINWFTLKPPDEPLGPLEMRAAMYTYPGVERVMVVGPDGAPLADSVLLAALEP
jgi:4-amino-4-deoxy-L-arabinose transferase-like glycosyltransferase